MQLLREHSIPLVFFDRYYEDVKSVCVTGNDFESSYLATEHLIQNGCNRIAYLAINKDVSIGKIRMNGYLEALRKYAIPVDENLILDTVNDATVNYDAIRELIQRHQPDGIFASVERLAISTIRVAKELGVAIPQQMKLICFSCLDINDMLNPSLSVVKQPADEMGKLAAQYLFDIMSGKKLVEDSEVVYLTSTLIFQDSSKKTEAST